MNLNVYKVHLLADAASKDLHNIFLSLPCNLKWNGLCIPWQAKKVIALYFDAPGQYC